MGSGERDVSPPPLINEQERPPILASRFDTPAMSAIAPSSVCIYLDEFRDDVDATN